MPQTPHHNSEIPRNLLEPKRIVTGHDDKGRAVFHEAKEVPSYAINNGAAYFSVLYSTDSIPADNSEPFNDPIKQKHKDLAKPNGSVVRVVDLPPHSYSPFHRTTSLDYGICITGTPICELDDGIREEMKPGDVCVQRGTIHAWVNETNEWQRIVFILLGSEPVVINGKALPDAGLEEASG